MKDGIVLQGVPLPTGVGLAIKQFDCVRACPTEGQPRVRRSGIDPQVNLHQGVCHLQVPEQGKAVLQPERRPALPQQRLGGGVREVQVGKRGQIVTVPFGHGGPSFHRRLGHSRSSLCGH